MNDGEEGMVAKGCEEKISTHDSERRLKKEIVELQKTLKNAFSQYEQNESLKEQPDVWISYIKDAIERTGCLLKLRNDYPKMKDTFARLEASCQHAEGRLPEYAKAKGVQLSDHTD